MINMGNSKLYHVHIFFKSDRNHYIILERYYRDQCPKTMSHCGSCTGQCLLVFKHVISITRPVPLTLFNFNFEQGPCPWEERYIGQRRLYIQEKFTLRANICPQNRSEPSKEFVLTLPCH